jgi:hypothetical protein
MTRHFEAREWGRQRRRRWLQFLIVLLATAAALKLADEFRRLVWDSGPHGAVDLKHLHTWTTLWFNGHEFFSQTNAAVYPPATYVMIWPLLGWMPFNAARWLWAGTSILALIAIILLIVRIAAADTRQEKVFVALLLLSINGTGVALGNGQLILHLLPALLAGMMLLERDDATLGREVSAAALITWAMIKPSVAAPFLCILFGWQRWRVLLLVLLFYAVLTLAAASFQQEELLTLFKLCLAKASIATAHFAGTRNIHALLVAAGLERWLTLSSVVIFGAFGVWATYYRAGDRWILVAVAALVARMWSYHRLYDDVLILLPEIALFRIANQSLLPRQRTIAGALLAVTALAMLCPARFLDQPSEWSWVFNTTHAILWLALLTYLTIYAHVDRPQVIRTTDR